MLSLLLLLLLLLSIDLCLFFTITFVEYNKFSLLTSLQHGLCFAHQINVFWFTAL